MRAALLGLLLATTAGLGGPVHAQELFPLQQVPVTSGGSCTPAGSPCPIGVQAPAGYHWNLTERDEFTQDTSINTSIWCNGWQNGTEPCNSNMGLSFDSVNGLGITPPMNVPQSSNTYARGGMAEQPAQQFGFWQWEAKEPTDFSGEGDGLHSDVFFHDTQPGSEIDADEKGIGTGNRNYTWAIIGDNGDGLEYTYPNNVNLDESFHTYGMWWMNTGGSGSVQFFFDSQPTNSPYQLVDPSWASHPIYGILMLDGCYSPPTPAILGGNVCTSNTSGNNPFYLKYWRRWQLEPN